MKNFNPLLVLFFIAITISCSTDDTPTDTNPGEGTIEIVHLGDLELKTQEEVDDFIDGEHIEIGGNLQIGTDEKSNISDLSNLNGIRKITGSLIITNNCELLDLNGLENLVEVGENVEITKNCFLSNYSAFQNLIESPNFNSGIIINGNKYNPNLSNLKSGNYQLVNKKLIAIETFPSYNGFRYELDSIFYNDDGRRSLVKTYVEGRLSHKRTFEYTVNQIIQYDFVIHKDIYGQDYFYNILKFVYQLENDLVVLVSSYGFDDNGNEMLNNYNKYEIDQSKKANNISKTEYYNSTGTLIKSETFKYTDCLGSGSITTTNAVGLLIGERTYTMDDKVGWYQFTSVLDYQNPHNIIFDKITDVNTGSSTEIEYFYTYDEYGYPIKLDFDYGYGLLLGKEFVFE